MSEQEPTKFFARGPSGKFDVPIEHSQINKQLQSAELHPLPEDHENPYQRPVAAFEAAGRAAIHATAASLPPIRGRSMASPGEQPPLL